MAKVDVTGATAMHDLHVTDLFMNSGYITIGDPYTKGSEIPDRYKGKQFATNPVKKGRTDKELISRGYVPLASGDKYVDIDKMQRQEELAKTKKNISTKPFTPASPMKKMVGRGGPDAFLHGNPEHKPELDTKPRQKGDVKPTPRNFLCNPTKKGGYGYANTTIGRGTEFKYESDPYGGVKKDKKGDKGKGPTKPFVSMDNGQRKIDISMYSDEGIPKKKEKPKPKAKPITVPFKGMSHTRETINPFPEYFKSESKPRPKTQPVKVWKPSGTNDLSVPQPSIATTGIVARSTFERSMRH
ncbi:putative protein of unknown function (DUF4586) [Blattamonas nauphoetae]|uniref:Cilia-and flagella-associated protein 96 n=1 Tax=Blattamonas nauphoetae TaxID=2049346 RepID=A0ABQ9XM02_9EUKA|nr:putative protein of unknown function (DUF4586) [Blattamonas nauphoetae]